jgi:hypothetical protein
METWVKNALYDELVKMPLWVDCAFENDGQFTYGKKQNRVICTIVGEFMARCPASLYDKDYHMNAKMEDFRPVAKKAWETCSSWVRNKYDRASLEY